MWGWQDWLLINNLQPTHYQQVRLVVGKHLHSLQLITCIPCSWENTSSSPVWISPPARDLALFGIRKLCIFFTTERCICFAHKLTARNLLGYTIWFWVYGECCMDPPWVSIGCICLA
jgi:hypothetical protein